MFCFVSNESCFFSIKGRGWGEATILSPLFGAFWLLSSLTCSELSCRSLSLGPEGGSSRVGVLGSPHLQILTLPLQASATLPLPTPKPSLPWGGAARGWGGGTLVETPARTKHIHLECSLPTDRQVPQHWSQQALASPLHRAGVPETLNERTEGQGHRTCLR